MVSGNSTHIRQVIVIFGVSGCGKSTIARLLSDRTGLPYFDADDFHPKDNIEKMARGLPLNDEDREPWLEALSTLLEKAVRSGGGILACSALKEKYRKKLAGKTEGIQWVFLKGDFDLIKRRMEARQGHFMKPEMLRSQFETLEEPKYGMVISIEDSPEHITERIILNLRMKHKSTFGIFGLGVMGRSLALNIADQGFTLSAYNRAEGGEERVVEEFLAENPEYDNIQGFTNLEKFIDSLERPRKILLMIKAGPVVDRVIEQLLPLLAEGDVLVDGGNSHYTDTSRRIEMTRKAGVGFIGAGISGGEEGARNGPSIMPGGDRVEYEKVAAVLESIAARDASGNPCCRFVGPEGSGHFVKMVHNGIEYVEMQLLAELYGLLKGSMSNEEMAALFESWNKGPLESYLLSITARILRKKEGDRYVLDTILDRSGNKGTGSWSSKEALDLGVPNTMMSTAVFERYLSSFKSLRTDLASRIPMARVDGKSPDPLVLERAYAFARLINHQQGFQLLDAASREFDWGLDFPVIARIWSNGCIIKSALMNRLEVSFTESDDPFSIAWVREELALNERDVVSLLELGLKRRIALPCFSASLGYWINMTTAELPANLIQAQRDFFGAHRYQRVDDPEGGSHHTEWI